MATLIHGRRVEKLLIAITPFKSRDRNNNKMDSLCQDILECYKLIIPYRCYKTITKTCCCGSYYSLSLLLYIVHKTVHRVQKYVTCVIEYSANLEEDLLCNHHGLWKI